MKLLSRHQPTAEEIAAAAQAEDQRRRLAAQFARDQAAADREEQRRAEREQARAEKRRRKAKAKARARRRARLVRWAKAGRTVGPLLVVNAATVGGQLAYAYSETPADWHPVARVAVAVGVATAAESVALYVGWHAHDALLADARTTAARLRRASYAIALIMAAVNYSHFADGWEPTALAVILGVLSSLSPWLWGLHTRRAQHVQLLREDLVDQPGAEFDPARRRAFPIRSRLARRWSIDNNVRDPRLAWEGYKAWRVQRSAVPVGRLRAAWRALLGRPAAGPAQAEPAGEDLGARICRELPGQVARVRRSVYLWATDRAVHGPAGPHREPAHETNREPAQRRAGESTRGRGEPKPEPEHRAGEPVQPTDERLASAWKRFTAREQRKPSDQELADEAGVSKSTAWRWKTRMAQAA